MHIYTDSRAGKPQVRLLAADSVLIDFGTVRMHVYSAAEADEMIIAATEAKRLLDPPVIPPAERDCDQVNPDGSGEHCYRGGDHGVHRDSNGTEWRTDLGELSAEALYDDESGEDATESVAASVQAERAETEPLPLTCGCSVPLGHLGIFRPGHSVMCVTHGPTTVADLAGTAARS